MSSFYKLLFNSLIIVDVLNFNDFDSNNLYHFNGILIFKIIK